MKRRIAKITAVVVLTPICFVLLVSVLLYVPAFQQWAVDRACAYVKSETGLDTGIDRVRLSFPLDLALEGVHCTQHSSLITHNSGDTIADVRKVVLNVELLPLLDGDIHVNAVNLCDAYLNTADFIHTVRVKGFVGELKVTDENSSPVASVALDSSVARLGSISLDDAHLNIELSDTVPKDTAKKENFWKIYVSDLSIRNSSMTLHLPGDTLQIGASLGDVKASKGFFDLHKGLYDVSHLAVSSSAFSYDNNFERHLLDGFDSNHIALSGINLSADSIHYGLHEISAHIRQASLREQSGITLKSLQASVKVDSTLFRVTGALSTPASSLALDVKVRPNIIDSLNLDDGMIDAKVDASVGREDLMNFAFRDMPKAFRNAWPVMPLAVKGEVHGNLRQVTVPWLSVVLPSAFALDAKGEVGGFMNYPHLFRTNLHADMRTYNLAFLKSFLDQDTQRMITFPAMHLMADLKAKGQDYDLSLTAVEGTGRLMAKARVNAATVRYDARVNANNLNLGHFVNGIGLGLFSGSLSADGCGFDIKAKSTRASAKADVDHLHYKQNDLDNIHAALDLNHGRMEAKAEADNEFVVGQVSVNGTIDTRLIDILLDTDIRRVDFYRLKMTDSPLVLGLSGNMSLLTDMDEKFKVKATVNDINLEDSARSVRLNDIMVDFITTHDTLSAKVGSGDLTMTMNARSGYRGLLQCGSNMLAALQRSISERTINQEDIRENLPDMSLSLHMGRNNAISKMLEHYNMLFSNLDFSAHTSSENGIFADLAMENLSSDGVGIDTIKADIRSENNPMEIFYNARIKNSPKNIYVFDALLDGKVLPHGATANARLYNARQQLALQLGAEAMVRENGICLTSSLENLDIGKIMACMPNAPRMYGQMHGVVNLVQNEDASFSMTSDMDIRDLTYENHNLGNLGGRLTYLPKEGGLHNIDAIVRLNDSEVGSLSGSYNTEASAIDASVKLAGFPMEVANGFIPQQLMGLEGKLNGSLDIQGTTASPMVNGSLSLHDAVLLSVPYGIRLLFDDSKVNITDSRLVLDDFKVFDSARKPLTIDGSVDFSNPDHISIDTKAEADGFQIVNRSEEGHSDVYGNVLVNCMATIKGETDRMKMRGTLEVLPSTNLYYILRDSPLSEGSSMDETITFSTPSDTTAVTVVKPKLGEMSADMNIVVEEGAHLKCWLNETRSNYVDIIGNGDLRMSLRNDDIRMTGRYTITEGEMKYSMPVIPLKTFTIESGSYVEWGGEIMNPRMNITATESVKAVVKTNDVDETVSFNTGVRLSHTLNEMGLEFIIEAPENATVAEELAQSSAEERGKLAVAMLTTGMYLSVGNKAKASMTAAVNSFLESQINRIAGNATNFVDLSVGVESSTDDDGKSSNDYSIKMAKKFWNNRVSVSIGGKVGKNASKQNKAFFDNMELQYRLSDTSNKYLQLFYRMNVYDALEGNLSQYGAGFIWKRKGRTFLDLFRRKKNKKVKK